VFFIASRHGFMVAFLSLVAGVGGLLVAGPLGAPSQAPAIGFLALGAVAWLLGRHEPERNRACSLFFIPLRLYAVVALGIGALFLFVPGRPGTAPAPEEKKLNTIEARLRNDVSSGSSGGAQEKAAEYQKALAAFEKISGIDGKVSVHLDLDSSDLRAVRKASLYIQSFNLKKYSDDAKKSLVEICFKMLKADFPDAALNVAARGPFLWGVRGSLVNGAQVLRVGSESPNF
jgi:hypothetical protein